MLGTILEAIVRLHDTTHGFLSLRNAIGHLEVSAIIGFDESIVDDLKKLRLGEGSCGKTMRSKTRTIVEDTDVDPLFKNLKEMTRKHGFRAVHTTPILDRAGECIGVLAVHFREPRRPTEMEILLTDMYVREAAEFMGRMQSEQALLRSEKQLRLATEKADIGIWEMDLVRKTGSWSGRAVDTLGGGKKPFSGDVWEQVCHEDDCAQVRLTWQDILKEDAPCEMEFRLRAQPEDENESWFLVRGRVERNGSGEPLYAAGVVFDVTEKRLHEAAMKDADRRKNEFLATLAHELRNPLAPIKNALHIIDAETADAEIKVRARQLMRHQVNHMERLVDDLMDVSRISQGKIELKRECISLSEAVQLSVDAVRPLIEDKGLSVFVQETDKDLWLYADSARISQILSNVLNNAAKYTIKGGITVKVFREGDQAVIQVKDTGIGIPERKLPYIFDMFMQVDNSMEKSYGGLGIGLTLVRSLLGLHGGSIIAESAGEGQGSAFTIRLPLSEKKEADLYENADKASVPVKKHRVLVVDDNESSANTLGWIFELMGHDFKVAHTAEQAIGITKEYKPDLVLLDIGMPGMNGYDLCRLLRKDPALASTTFVAQTGWGQKEHRRLSQEAGFHHHLVKPVSMPVLHELLQQIDAS